jgi:GT2 family glycosyltransferase
MSIPAPPTVPSRLRAPRVRRSSIWTSRSPFTAARARNEGLARLLEGGPLDYVQFIDGDCALQPGWIDTAQAFLDENPQAAVVHGRRRERYPEATVYNQLCDWEWDRPPGQAISCGGDAMMRVAAFQAVGGYDPHLIAGEEPELCVRLRAAGWQIWCLDAEMTLHDAAMTRFGQYWRRARRAGHAYAEGAAMHGAPPERHGVRGATGRFSGGRACRPRSLIGRSGPGPRSQILASTPRR